jgi:uncharacterized protein
MRAHSHLLALASLLFSLFVTFAFTGNAAAASFVPPALEGPVTDAAGKLSPSDKEAIAARLRGIRTASGVEITVFLPQSLEGNPIEDVAYETARAWHLGKKGTDAGVLLVIATQERKIRIETAKGSGGDLTDLQSNEIIRERIAPRMKAGDVAGAIEAGIDGIQTEMHFAGPQSNVRPRAVRPQPGPRSGGVGSFIAVILLVIIFVVFRVAIGRRRGGGGRGGGGGYYGGGGGWGGGGDSGGGDSGGSSGGDWGGGGGGGGDWGGGGSSGDY